MNLSSKRGLQIDNFTIMRLEDIISNSDGNPDLSLYINGASSFCCILILEKDATHIVNSKEYYVRKGECFFIMQDSVQTFIKESEYKGIIAMFTEIFIFRYGSRSASNFLCDRRKRLINLTAIYHNPNRDNIINFIFKYPEIEGNYRDSRVGTMFIAYILKMFESGMTNAYRAYFLSNNDIFRKFNRLLIDNSMNSRDAKEYAKELGVSYGVLNRVCKNSVNMTPKKCIDYILIIEAKRQLFTTNRSIQDIALDLNFDGASNFSKYFKKQTGILPLKFKERVYQCNCTPPK